jgi:hypothetical protein
MSSLSAVQGGSTHVYAQQVAQATTRQAEERAETATAKASELRASQPRSVDVRV